MGNSKGGMWSRSGLFLAVRQIPTPLRMALGVGADEYELFVDRERGVLLRVTKRFKGVDLLIGELLEPVFDQEISADTFEPAIPPGQVVREGGNLAG